MGYVVLRTYADNTYKSANVNFSISTLVQCVVALQYCYIWCRCSMTAITVSQFVRSRGCTTDSAFVEWLYADSSCYDVSLSDFFNGSFVNAIYAHVRDSYRTLM